MRCGARRNGNGLAYSRKTAVFSAFAALFIASFFCVESRVDAAEPPVVGQWDSLFGVAFGSPGNAFVVGAKGTLLESDNDGVTWKRHQLGDPVAPYDLFSIRFAPDGKTGWIVGEAGTIFRTRDGGKTWEKVQSPVKDSLFKIAVMDSDAACAVGANGSLLCTENGGSSWTLNHFMDFTFFDVAFSSKSAAWAVGDYKTVISSADAGKHWQLQSGGKRVFTEPPNFAVAFNPSGDGVIAALGPAIQETKDAGKSWQSLPLTETKQVYSAVANRGASASEFWIAGGEGLLVDIGNGTISKVPTGVAADITDVSFSGDNGIAVGLGGTLLHLRRADDKWRVAAHQTRIGTTKQIALSESARSIRR
jgi:photosystem II stability/assembly factor-like uncharacterized protein